MVFKFFPNIKNNGKGVTLIEIVVVVFLIALFSVIMISDFPKIQRNFALSRSAYKFAQDLRKAEDLGLSGVSLYHKEGEEPIMVKGYGFYVNKSNPLARQYVIYADVAGEPDGYGVRSSDQEYNYNGSYDLCADAEFGNGERKTDCVIELIDLGDINSNLFISDIIDSSENPISANAISINFSPPNPDINIKDSDGNTYNTTRIGFVLGLISDTSATRKVWVNTSGLINVQ